MRYCLLFIVFFLLAVNHDTNQVRAANDDHVNKQMIKDSDLRKGFVPIYSFTNWFIDLMKPNYPPSLINETASYSSLQQFEDAVVKYFLSSDWKFYANQVFQISAGTAGFLIACIVFMIVMPLVGLFYCCCNTCCKCGKKDPYEGDKDKCKRRVFALILFIFLICLLLLVVCLFATNNYATQVSEKTPNIVKNQLDAIKNYYLDEIYPISTRVIHLLDEVANNGTALLNVTKNDLFDTIKGNFSTEIDKIRINVLTPLNRMIDILQYIRDQNATTVKSFNDALANFNTALTQHGITPFIPELVFPDLPDPYDLASLNNKLDTLNETFHEIFDNYSSIADSSFGMDISNIDSFVSIINTINGFGSEIADFNQTLAQFDSSSIVPYVSKYTKYYNYAYYSLVGISSFMLLLFVILIIGTLGICCHRRDPDEPKTCDRGGAANCLMAGVGLFFIFIILLMIIVMSLFAVGIVSRHILCSPAIELDEHPVIKVIKHIDSIKVIENITFTKIISECRKSSSILYVDEIDKIFKIFNVEYTPSDFRNGSYIADEIYAIIESEISSINEGPINIQSTNIMEYYQSLNRTGIVGTIDELENLTVVYDGKLTTLQSYLNNVSSSDSTLHTPAVQLNATIPAYHQFLTTLTSNLTDFRTFYKEMEIKFNQSQLEIDDFVAQLPKTSEEIVKFLLKFLNDTNFKKTLTEFIKDTIDASADLIPSCKIVADVYDNTTIPFCYEFVDNLNSFWFALWLSLVLFLILMPISIRLAKIFRKIVYVGYDDVEEYTPRSTKSNDVAMQNLKGRRIHPIDAYTQSGYNNAGHTPPPHYKNTYHA